MINTPSSGPRMRLTASLTNLMESMSSPESVSSRIAISGFNTAICRISARFFSPPENPSLTYRERKESSMRSTDISSLSSARNSLTLIALDLSLPSKPRLALIAVRRKFDIVIPGTTTGYCSARNMPSFARCSGCNFRMSWPLNNAWPLTTLSFGWPIRVCDSVLLPDPFGPITACTSPLLTDSDTPLRISRPSTLTRRSLISKSAIVSVSLPVDSVFKSSSVLLLVRIAVERDPERVDGERRALHPRRADRDTELLEQVPGGKTLELLHRLADDQVGQHRGGRLADGATPAAEAHVPHPAIVQLEVEGDDVAAERVVALLGDIGVRDLPEMMRVLVVLENLLAVEIVHVFRRTPFAPFEFR